MLYVSLLGELQAQIQQTLKNVRLTNRKLHYITCILSIIASQC